MWSAAGSQCGDGDAGRQVRLGVNKGANQRAAKRRGIKKMLFRKWCNISGGRPIETIRTAGDGRVDVARIFKRSSRKRIVDQLYSRPPSLLRREVENLQKRRGMLFYSSCPQRGILTGSPSSKKGMFRHVYAADMQQRGSGILNGDLHS